MAKGWVKESDRHALSAKGVKTGRKAQQSRDMKFKNDDIMFPKEEKEDFLDHIGIIGTEVIDMTTSQAEKIPEGIDSLDPKKHKVDEERKDIAREMEIQESEKRLKELDKSKEFARDSKGKISDTELSPYGKEQLASLDNVELYFKDEMLTVKGDKLVDADGKVIETIDNDRMVNKVIFKMIGG